jgi:hypothetical protein
MTHQEFYHWLQGYLDNPGRPYTTPYSDYEKYLQIIKDKMKLVENAPKVNMTWTAGNTSTTFLKG